MTNEELVQFFDKKDEQMTNDKAKQVRTWWHPDANLQVIAISDILPALRALYLHQHARSPSGHIEAMEASREALAPLAHLLESENS
jgi:hypothetical protein